MIRAIIIEDEELAIDRLRLQLSEIDQSIEIVTVLKSVQEAVRWLTFHSADLIFLDINLSDGNSFKIFDQVQIETPIIFTTAYHDYAIRAFEHFSIDYLLKPISKEKLSKSLSKFKLIRNNAISRGSIERLIDLIDHKKSSKKFMVNIGSKVKVIDVSDIGFFSFDNKITFIYDNNGKRYPIDLSLKQVEESLSPHDFFRVNRQYLIGRRAVVELQYYSSTRIKLHLSPKSQEDVFLARDKIGRFKRWLME